MTKEKIQLAAEEWSTNIFGKGGSESIDDEKMLFRCIAGKKGFKAGANWRIESVWHDGSETPKFGCSILGITIFGEPIIDGPFGIEYDVNIDMSNIKKWAYLKDLMSEK